ncbi:MAG: DUF2256 domain-containing protein [Planctomycetota bacterium]
MSRERSPRSERASKTCVVCGRSFQWRRKWARCWEQVRYCSQRCRQNKCSADAIAHGEAAAPSPSSDRKREPRIER